MDIAQMMELLSAQRHDFLNHLQVISGFLQLHREKQARDYIGVVTNAMADLSKAAHLAMPEAAAVLLSAVYRAARYQIKVVFDIQTDLAGCTLAGPEVASLLEEILAGIIDRLSAPNHRYKGAKPEILIAASGALQTGLWRIRIDSPDTVLEICLANNE